MNFTFDFRSSELPLVERVWRTHSVGGGSFVSAAASQWEMVVTKQQGKTTFTVRAPETNARPSPVPEDAEFFGIQFKLGAYMPHLPTDRRVNLTLDLPEASTRSFWLHGSAWQFPDYENADTFIARLMRDGLLMCDPVVEAALQGHSNGLSARSVQRRFVRATGLTHAFILQIERAHRAAALLQQNISILDTVEQAGYSDQPHLTRSLKRFIGQTPAQILRPR